MAAKTIAAGLLEDFMNRIQWEKAVSTFRNRFILRGILLTIGIPFAGILTLLAVLSENDIFGTDAKYVFCLIGIFSVLIILLVFTLYSGKFAPGFIVDDEGIVNYSQQKQAKKNKLFNMFLIIFGLFRGSYAPAGTEFLSQTRQVMKIRWNNMRNVHYYPKQCTILVKGGFTEKIVVFCTRSNYDEVARKVREKMEQYSKI